MIFKTKFAYENWASKYRYGDESPLETFQRIAKAVASVEQDPDYWYPIFLETLVKFEGTEPVGLKATFGGRITANAGTDFAATTLMNCFINGPVSDAIIEYYRDIPGTEESIKVVYSTEEDPDNLANIMLTLLEQAETLKSEGGYGINFGFIRPRGTLIKGVGIRHPGVVKYMTIWDRVADVIVMGDNDGYKDTLTNYAATTLSDEVQTRIKKMARKGAQMAVLPVWHPDIEEFVRAKQTPGVLTKFNISVLVDDAFMNAVKRDELYRLHFKGETHKLVKAKDLYELVMKSTYTRNEPGILFYDTMQRLNPLAYLGPVDATNPCGEIPGNPAISTVCLLGSLNLTQYIAPNRGFLIQDYFRDVAVFTRMLDNINDLSYMPLPQYDWAKRNIRQFGMGLNGLGSMFYMMGIPYNSSKARIWAETLAAGKENIVWQTSAKLAQEKGTFPAFDERFFGTDWYKNAELWPQTRELMETYGVRNGKTTTNPPLGNSSVICDNISNGIEPVFSHSYRRTYILDVWPEGLSQENVTEVLRETKVGDALAWKGEYQGQHLYYEPHNRGLCAIETVEDFGYAWVREHFPREFEGDLTPHYMVTTAHMNVEDHLGMQETIQRHVNQSISKTSNLPADYSFDAFSDLYIEAWKRNLVGFTTYRDGTMESVLSRVEEEKQGLTREGVIHNITLPDIFVNGPMRVIKREGQKFYLHFSYLPEDVEQIYPIAFWIKTNNTGTIKQANMATDSLMSLLQRFGVANHLIEDQEHKLKQVQVPSDRVARAVSMCLRHNIPIPNIVASLDSVPEIYVTDMLFAVKKFLSEQIPDGTRVSHVACSACGSAEVIFESGCTKCLDCGASNCG